MHPAFQYEAYLVKRQVLALTSKVRLYSPMGEMVLYCEQKMFRLREDIRLFSDESKSQELLLIQAHQILDFSAAYDVIDPLMIQRVGTLRRRGFRSLVQDEWQVLDSNEQWIGILKEDNLTRALLRRLFLGSLLPQDCDMILGETRAADLQQRFNPFRYELELDFRVDPMRGLDPRLGIAAAVLLAVIEGRQDSG